MEDKIMGRTGECWVYFKRSLTHEELKQLFRELECIGVIVVSDHTLSNKIIVSLSHERLTPLEVVEEAKVVVAACGLEVKDVDVDEEV